MVLSPGVHARVLGLRHVLVFKSLKGISEDVALYGQEARGLRTDPPLSGMASPCQQSHADAGSTRWPGAGMAHLSAISPTTAARCSPQQVAQLIE